MELHQLIKYFGNDCSADEQQAIETWRASSPKNNALFLRLEKMWTASQNTPETLRPDFEKAWDNIQAKTGIRPKHVTRILGIRYLWRIAAIVIVLLGVGLLLRTVVFPKQILKVEGCNGPNKKEVHLADGSIVTLNRNSRVIYPSMFNGTTREITLEGEAFFKVAKDAAHPFIVHASGTRVRVLGTSFNIKIKGKEQVQVSVVTGKVAFQSDKNASSLVQLSKGEQASFDKLTENISKQPYTDENFMAWETGILTFRNAALIQVAKVMSESYSTSIEVDPSLQKRVITVTFNNQSLNEALEIMKITLNVDIQYSAGKIIMKPLENQPK